jgi:hypothetical protein
VDAGVKISKSGVRVMLTNRAYLGMASRPTERKGEVEWVAGRHEPIVTETEFQAAQAGRREYVPRDGSIVKDVRLARLVYCATCGKRMQVQRGKDAAGVSYACRTDDCEAKATIRASILEPWVAEYIHEQSEAFNPAIMAVLLGEDRYASALADVTAAQNELDAYRTHVKVSDVGAEAWKTDVQHRQEALDVARAALRDVPQPRGESVIALTTGLDDLREVAPVLIESITVSPVGRGRRVRPAERCAVQFAGQ